MNICHTINDLSRGGAETHLLSLVKVQLQKGHKVSVLLLGRDLSNFFSLEDDFKSLKINIFRLKGPKKIQGLNPISIIKAVNIFKKENFDIIHTHSPRSNLLTYVSLRLITTQSKHIVSIHGKYGTYLQGNKLVDLFRSRFVSLLSKIWEKSDGVIVISESIKKWLFNINPKILPKVINYGIEIPLLENFINNDKEFCIGFLGKLNKNKGIEDLLFAFHHLEEQNSITGKKLKLIIGGVGQETYLNKIQQKVNDKNIEFLGYVEDRKSFFKSLNLFVFPSYSEGLGLVLLEAMAHGVVTLTRNVSPMNHIIKDQYNGYLFNSNEELINKVKIASLLSNSERKELLANGSKTIVNSYSIIQMYSSINHVYQN
tara:strand:- start:86 stop:1198 length:1113 start_codon:yes stop_codon:yes gene_type:complete